MDYYIDVDRLFDIIVEKNIRPLKEVTTEILYDEEGNEIKEEVTKTIYPSIEINAPKYELLTSMIETVMNNAPEDSDPTLGFDHAIENSDFSFKLAYNTLLQYEILKQN
jgi:hypothetical protein